MSMPAQAMGDEVRVRAEAVSEYGLWIKREALRTQARMPWADVDDLIQWGTVALLESFGRFDASRGKPFEHFVKPRIRGAMLDSLRRDGNDARRACREPELLNERTNGSASASADPLDALVASTDAAVISEAAESLPEKQQRVLQLYYVEGFNNREVSRVLGVSESYVSRLHHEALEKLRSAIASLDRGWSVKENVA